VFTARYALSPYIKQIRFVFKGLIMPVRLSVCPSAWNNEAPSGSVLMKFCIWVLFVNVSRKFNSHWNLTRTTGALHEDLCTFMTISRSTLLRKRNVSTKVIKQIKIHIFCSTTFSRKPYRLWENVEKFGRARLAIDDNSSYALCMLDN
jgi:hypothetical protein